MSMSPGRVAHAGSVETPPVDPSPKGRPLASGVSAVGGADRDRTGDLRLARAALSQLSYSPVIGVFAGPRSGGPKWI